MSFDSKVSSLSNCHEYAAFQGVLPDHRSVSAAGLWNLLGAVLRLLLSVAFAVFMARILGPAPFGVFAVALVWVGLGQLFADLGLGTALIQRAELVPGQLAFAFWAHVLNGGLLGVVLVALAPLLGDLFGMTESVGVIQGMALVFPVQALGLASQALLRRCLRFKAARMVELSAMILAYFGLGVPLALTGWGVWSLVMAHLAQALLHAVLLLLTVRPPVLATGLKSGASLMGFGLRVAACNGVNWCLRHAEILVLSRAFGSETLGWYHRTATLVSMPVQQLLQVIQPVELSVLARHQDDPERMRMGYGAALSLVAWISLPFLAGVAAAPEWVVLGLLGDAFEGAVPLATPLALAWAAHAIMAVAGPVLAAINQVGREIGVSVGVLALFVPALLWASQHEARTVVWIVFAAYALRCLLMTRWVIRCVNAGWVAWLQWLRPAAMMALLVATLTWVIQQAAPTVAPEWGVMLLLLVIVPVAGGVVGAVPQWFVPPVVVQWVKTTRHAKVDAVKHWIARAGVVEHRISRRDTEPQRRGED